MNEITMKLVADKLIMQALEEDITSEDISTNAVMPKEQMGEVDLICKEDGVIAGLWVFERVFTLLDPNVTVSLSVKAGGGGYPGTPLRGAYRIKLSPADERDRYLHKKRGKTPGRQ